MRRLLSAAALAAAARARARRARRSDRQDDARRRPSRPRRGTGFAGARRGPRRAVRRAPRRQRQGGAASAPRTRRSLAFFAQLTDPQIADEMSPARVDFVDAAGGALKSSWRPQEALGDADVRRDRAQRQRQPAQPGQGRARASRARLGFALTTGDLADNQQLNETRWFRTVLDGGRVDPFSGQAARARPTRAARPRPTTRARINADVAARRYTGVQDYDDWRGAPRRPLRRLLGSRRGGADRRAVRRVPALSRA